MNRREKLRGSVQPLFGQLSTSNKGRGMRKIFSGYYRPDEQQFSELWETCLFVFDANVLLNLYRYSQETRDVLIDILTKVSERLWIPHQVALEYHENRLSTIATQIRLYDDISKELQTSRRKLEDLLSDEHPSINVESLLKRIESSFSEIEGELSMHKAQHPDLSSEDDIRDILTDLFEGKTGNPYPQERLVEIYKLGKDRYEHKIPPGYEDNKKGSLKRFGNLVIEDKFGDLILWLQIVDQAKAEKKPIIFVTDDTKGDWWWITQGRTVGPRPELITEIRNEADVMFFMYTPDRFMQYAGEYLRVEITQEVVDEVQTVTAESTSWKDEILNALKALGGEAHLSEIYDYIKNTTARNLAKTWKATVRYTLQIHSSDSEAYRGGEDLFVRLERGYWAIRNDNNVIDDESEN